MLFSNRITCGAGLDLELATAGLLRVVIVQAVVTMVMLVLHRSPDFGIAAH